MFSELVYTRCRQGVDILKGGRTISGDGFKVFSCSNNIINDDIVDLPFLFNIAQGKQAYNDPSFMDDAYLFITPDKGNNMMVDFHPIPFDKSARGDYSHRPGNFLNQVFIGCFQDFYPYELFGSPHAWNAKERGEAFYYDNPPTPLPERNDIDDSVGSIVLDDISAFVADGRKKALIAAVAFLLSQFSLPPENRKYLVIQDGDAAKIELWIAAIESAFSPRMASGLSFATRLDKFASVNKYTVNANGQYQAQMNLQDPNQRLRFRAMIVGVDERDLANTAAVRQLANSPYVILNGKIKSFIGDVVASHPYYDAITAFDDSQNRFCRKFLQMLDISVPSEDILKLYTAFSALDNLSETSDAKTIASSLSIIENYALVPNNYLSVLYNAIKNNLPRILSGNLSYAFTILTWLQKVSSAVGDMEATQSFNQIVSKAFCECFFCNPQSMGATEFWTRVQRSVFFDVVANYITDEATLVFYQETINKFTCDNWVAFLHVYLMCAQKVHHYSESQLYPLVSRGIYECYRSENSKAALQICELIDICNREATRPLLLRTADGVDNAYTKFIISLLLHSTPELITSNAKILHFCQELQYHNQGHFCVTLLQYRAKLLKNSVEREQFLTFVLSERCFSGYDLSDVYSTLDSNIVISDKEGNRISSMLQETRPRGALCKNSAHVCAALIFDDKKRRVSLASGLQEYVKQGFPSIENAAYAEKLADKVLSGNFEKSDLSYIFEMFSCSNFYLSVLIREILKSTTPKQNYVWNMLLSTIVRLESQPISDVVVAECTKLKQPEKRMAQLEEMITEPSLLSCFSSISIKVAEEIRKDAPQSKLGRLFGFISNDSKGTKR